MHGDGERGAIIWLCGLSGAGKTTIAGQLVAALARNKRPHYLLDGDVLREGLNRDLGFTAEDRAENVRRSGEVARILCDAGLVAVCAFITPYARDRRALRERLAPRYLEVFVDAPLAACAARDPKGLYARAARGEIKDMTGVQSPFEPPEAPDLRINSVDTPPAEAARLILGALAQLK